jgi:hypothetical protein
MHQAIMLHTMPSMLDLPGGLQSGTLTDQYTGSTCLLWLTPYIGTCSQSPINLNYQADHLQWCLWASVQWTCLSCAAAIWTRAVATEHMHACSKNVCHLTVTCRT